MEPIVGAIIVAIISTAGATLAATRRMSGRIATTEASKLWDESASMREEYRKERDELREMLTRYDERVVQLEARVGELEERNNRLAAENVNLLKASLDDQLTISRLREERDQLRQRVGDLEAQIGHRRSGDEEGT